MPDAQTSATSISGCSARTPKSVTYVLDGRHHTLATSGPEGAYLIVTRSTPAQLLTGVGTGRIVPVDGPITEIHYRDGATCHITGKSWIGGAYACTPSIRCRSATSRRRRLVVHARQVRRR